MHNGAAEVKGKYTAERSKKKKLPDETFEISSVCAKKIEDSTQKSLFSFTKKPLPEIEFSATLKLLKKQDLSEFRLHTAIFSKIRELIFFFKSYLKENKIFTKYIININGKELIISNGIVAKVLNRVKNENNIPVWNILDEIGKYVLNDKKYDAQEFNRLPQEKQSQIINTFFQGVTIKLRVSIEYVDLPKLDQIGFYLSGNKVRTDVKTENKAQDQEETTKQPTKVHENINEQKETESTKQESAQNKKVVPVTKAKFGFDVTNSTKQVTRGSIAVAAMRDNLLWFVSFVKPLNFFNTLQFLFHQPPKLPTAAVKEKKIWIDKGVTFAPNTASYMEYFKANKKQSKGKIDQTQEQLIEKQITINQAQNDARIALLSNEEGKKLDKIFIKIVKEYNNQDPETFRNIFNSVFNAIYFQNKQLHEVLEQNEVEEVLKILEIPHPLNNSLLDKEYLKKQVYRKKEQLLKLVIGINTHQPTAQSKSIFRKTTDKSHSLPKNNTPTSNAVPRDKTEALSSTRILPIDSKTRLKLTIEKTFLSREAYFYLIAMVVFISVLCLWHFPLGKTSILKGLAPVKERDSIERALNIGLPILIMLCVVFLVDTIYFKYKEYKDPVEPANACNSQLGFER